MTKSQQFLTALLQVPHWLLPPLRLLIGMLTLEPKDDGLRITVLSDLLVNALAINIFLFLLNCEGGCKIQRKMSSDVSPLSSCRQCTSISAALDL